jgi:hypothetical protein
MQTHLLLRDYPRALALRPTVLEEEPSGVLVFEEYKGSDNRAIAKLYESSEFEDSQWRILNSRPVFGCLGLITIQSGKKIKSKTFMLDIVGSFYSFVRMLCCYCYRLRFSWKNKSRRRSL